MEIFETAGIDVPEVEPKYDFWMVMAYWKSSPAGWWKVFPVRRNNFCTLILDGRCHKLDLP